MRRKTMFTFLTTLVFSLLLSASISTKSLSLSLPEFEFAVRNQTVNDFNLG
ncbi:MAG: hypothetical protein K0Q49_2237, partial [Haloplasmataceae bacterium]|nr:hypothetical protein [Haloplasmataceae bacterium]